MGHVISEGLEYIGRIDDDGYIFDISGHCSAKITHEGCICKVGNGEILGMIDEDGTIRDSSLNVIGRIQADGYVYIHSNRVCKVSSAFIERITPDARNAGEPSSYSGRSTSSEYSDSNYSDSGSNSFFCSAFFIKLVIGIILGIIVWATGWADLGAWALIACPIVVFLFSLIFKIFN